MTGRASSSHRDAPFARLRIEHRRALDRLRAFEVSLRPPALRVRDERPFRALARYLEGPLAVHLAAEDGVLYPALGRVLPELALALEPLREDHAELNHMTRNLSSLLQEPQGAQRDEQLGVLGRDLVDLLRLHIRKEERSIFDWSERALPTADRREIQRRLARILAPLRRSDRTQK